MKKTIAICLTAMLVMTAIIVPTFSAHAAPCKSDEAVCFVETCEGVQHTSDTDRP